MSTNNNNVNGSDNDDVDLLKIVERRLQQGSAESGEEEKVSTAASDAPSSYFASSATSSPTANGAAPPPPTLATTSGFDIMKIVRERAGAAASHETAGDLELVQVAENGSKTTRQESDNNLHDRTTKVAQMPQPQQTILTRQPEFSRQHQSNPGAYAIDGPGLANDDTENHSNSSSGMSSDDDDDDDDLDNWDQEQTEDIIANPIDDDQQTGLLPNAEPLTTNQRPREYWRKKLLCSLSVEIIVAFVVISMIIVLIVVLTSKQGSKNQPPNQNGSSRNPANPAEATATAQTFLESLNLPEYTLYAMERPRSPQSKAYQWLTNNINNKTSTQQDLPKWRLLQRFAMATFYYSLRGDHWVKHHGWMDWDTNECNWEQTHFGKVHSPELHCNDKGEIKALEFWITNNLEGTLPPEISILGKSLQKLAFLRDMQVEGTIPTEVGLLTKLTMLNFNTVAISGTLPTELGFLQSLEELVISTTPISGSLPSEFGKLGNLTIFKVVNTDLTGSLPVEFFRMHQLTVAVMASPGLISDSLLPEIIRNMPRLQFLALDQRKSGDEMPLPSEIGMLSELDNLHLVDWKIDGTVPTELGHLTELNFLTVRENSIAGTMPPELFELTNLIGLDIQANHLEGSLPPVLFSKLTNLQYLRINNNQFSGSIPTEVGLLSNLKKLQLQNTNLLGPLPITELLAMRNLTSLEVANTSLSGSIPKEMCGRMRVQEQGWFGGRFYEGKSENPVCHGTLLCGCNCTGCL